ncbi:uncharacterized protein HMPREF1541_09574 [Cyphellophora europaea CBS 101466]|uniref:FAD-binding PCMH-type domain-containing protein n=1 Tax=Cyphellophora europaea (strain CBS 101466) TaxID=1220924 RepID=W2SAI2_CYPE1|nr:uncharacterized protein HMPREF1541_09574 [Cyphellophora europaea CBS 101466]ETN45741.1 hypothetical protein HMPREF1541_09574 [Cyphellophora europaea CBS 101466]
MRTSRRPFAVLAITSLAYCTSGVYAQENSTAASREITGFPPCDALIEAGLGTQVLTATSNEYESRVDSWWFANARVRPWCFVRPQNTMEVSNVVKVLSDAGSGAGDWHIAVRSGGHSLPSANSIVNGVTIDLTMMNNSWYSPEQKVASVEPGAAWKDVYANLLDTANVTVTGGRDGGVGVGGFLLGGGNSYYSSRNGFGCDTVVNYEVVLANGTIVNANASTNPDLWRALKGGGMNFGIVTRFDIEAMPAVDFAYGQSVLSTNYSDAVVDVIVNFTNNPEEMENDHLIPLYSYNASEGGQSIILIGVNTQGDLNSPAFDGMNSIPALSRTWEHKSLARAANESQVAGGLLYTQSTLTLPANPTAVRRATALHSSLIRTLTATLGPENFSASTFLQPLPTQIAKAGSRSGGSNVLGLDRIPGNAILWVSGVGVQPDAGDAGLAVARAELKKLVAELREFARGQDDVEGMEWTYLNYADADQDPLGSYGEENVRFMQEVAERYDPEGFWQGRVPGGFKVGRVEV